MTLPEQSDRAVSQTREFLVRLASPYGEGAIKGIKREVRAEASRLLRHYPYSWGGNCPDQDNGTNEDTVGRTLARRITGLQATLEADRRVSLQSEKPAIGEKPTLTDAERAAVEWCVEMALSSATDCVAEIRTLRGLLGRMR
jgi:hypothetical protein